MERGFMRRIRRSLNRSTSSSLSSISSSSRKNSIMEMIPSEPIDGLCTDKNLQRDFREFLCSTIYMPEMIVYVDFISVCDELKLLSGAPLKTEIERIYNHHIRTYAADKIFFDDLGALKMEIEIKLQRPDFDVTFYSKAVHFCFEKLRVPFDVYWNQSCSCEN